jgi:hypothetical protein
MLLRNSGAFASELGDRAEDVLTQILVSKR